MKRNDRVRVRDDVAWIAGRVGRITSTVSANTVRVRLDGAGKWDRGLDLGVDELELEPMEREQ